ncbi:radical SAM family heme chaperone HemW [Desulfurobacterium sp.]
MSVKHLYVHVPFCRAKCPYCDFYSTTAKVEPEKYLILLRRELELRNLNLKPDTIYFGGGTPSLMPPSFFESIITLFPSAKEITIEANPDDITKDYLKSLKETGVNRISIGVQSFQDKLLRILNRRHDGSKALNAVETAMSIFKNVSIDLMFGIPQQSEKELEKDLKTAVTLHVPHISSYALTVYKNTPLYAEIKNGSLTLPSEEEFSNQYRTVVSILESHGYEQYEISNFSRHGFRCKHNLSYWNLENYAGIGPSAASLISGNYRKNISNFKSYTKNIFSNNIKLEENLQLTNRELFEMKLAMGLRKKEGVTLTQEEFNRIKDILKKSSFMQTLIKENIIHIENCRIKINQNFFFISTTVISRIVAEIEPLFSR